MNIGIGFVPGRKQFHNVLKAYINNWLENGLLSNKKIRIHLLIAGDLSGEKANLKNYKNIESELRERISSITLVDKNYMEREIARLTASGKLNDSEARLVFGDGYAKKRNLIFYSAVKMKLHHLLFLNDDEYPMAALKNDNNPVLWMGQSIAGTHLKYNARADITCGHQCGYNSPIPAIAFGNQFSEKDLGLFIKAIGNGFLSWDSQKNNLIADKGVSYADQNIIKKEIVTEIKEVKRIKLVAESSLCFNLEGRKSFPPFFNPPGVSAGNTFMSTCLSDFTLLKIPCYTFHDGFDMHKSILTGVLPARFLPADKTEPAIVDRFVKATIGWIRCKPLLVFINQTGSYEKIMAGIKSDLELTIPKLCSYFSTDEFQQLRRDLDYYDRNVRRHYNLFSETKRVWALITASLKNGRPI